MHCVKKIQDDLYWVGASDRRLALFENVYPIPEGVSYNAYVLLDEKTVLLDTVDLSVSRQFFENLEFVLNGRTLDYIIVDHMEPDHAATLQMCIRDRSMPVSSSMVNTASSGGCSSSLLSSTANAIATAMPSSPPSVVPSADTQSPSTRS